MYLVMSDLKKTVERIVAETPVADMHTHIYPPSFGPLLLWGIDELLTYHYLVAEVLRTEPMYFDDYWRLSKKEQADYIWEHLFIRRAPISEASRGVVTCLEKIGLDPAEKDLDKFRAFFADQKIENYIETVFQIANVSYAVMTNDPFDATERKFWDEVGTGHPRFQASLRIDPLLVDWDTASTVLREQGYDVNTPLDEKSYTAVRKFLDDWADRINPRYLAVSLPPSFMYPADDDTTKILDRCILPFASDRNLPFSMMIGVKKLLNPHLQLAGDSVGKADLSSVENLCLKYPDNKFLVTLLSRENQHEICVIARKFPNLMPFGCWWFMNNPSIIKEITRERIELLGWSFIPQHSDARVLDQLLYKWPHSRRIIADVLTEKYKDISRSGWRVTEAEIRRDVIRLFSLNFDTFAPLPDDVV